jgi:hypothetical protein
VKSFPSSPQRLTAFAVLTDGLGEATLALRVTRLDTIEVIYHRSWPMRFSNPLVQVRILLNVDECSFPEAGRYEFALVADGEEIVQCVLKVFESEN